MDIESAKLLGAGIAVLGVIGSGIGIGSIFSAFISAVGRNPGAREHVFFHKLLESKTNVSLFSINPNAAISSISTALYFDFNFQNLKQAIIDNFINLILVGPEIPLIDGVYDFVKSDNEISDTIVIGPSKNGAMLEGSKDFAKEFMSKYSIPTAQSKSFTKESISEGINYLKNKKGPYVLKADGPAAGKGVVIVDKFYEAKIVLEDMLLNNSFGKSSETVVIEEFLSGIEMSCFVLFDGKNYLTPPLVKTLPFNNVPAWKIVDWLIFSNPVIIKPLL